MLFPGKCSICNKSHEKYLSEGCLPWGDGYNEYKWCYIENIINNGNFDELVGNNKFGYHLDERVVEIPWFISRLPSGKMKLLDAGSALNHISILRYSKVLEKKVVISTLAPEENAFYQMGISYIYEDLRDTMLNNETFDVVACISTIEHVGLDNTFIYTDDLTKKENTLNSYLYVIDTLRNLLKPGGKLFLTFPFGKYKNHGWFQVFNSENIDSIIHRFNPSKYFESIFLYENDRWNISNRNKSSNADYYDINVNKSYAPDFCAAAQSVACVELIK